MKFITKDIGGISKEVFQMKYKYPEPTAAALILNPKNEVLLIKSNKWRNKYTIPGGHIEVGEKIIEALKREVMEETGLKIFDIVFLDYHEFIFGDEFWKKKHFIFFDFICKTNSFNVALNHESQAYVWISLKEALSLPLETYTRRLIENYIKKNFSGKTT